MWFPLSFGFFFFNDTATTEIYTLSLHDALPILWIWKTKQQMTFLMQMCNPLDRKSTRLNSSHLVISYAVFCLKKKKKKHHTQHASTQTARRTYLRHTAAARVSRDWCFASASHPDRLSFVCVFFFFFFFNDTATTEIYTLSLHDALPISRHQRQRCDSRIFPKKCPS